MECAPGCTLALLRNKKCDQVCNSSECSYDSFQCVKSKQLECAPGCTEELRTNEVCDDACNVVTCDFDDYHCRCTTCSASLPVCGEECMRLQCNYGMYGHGGCTSDLLYTLAQYITMAERKSNAKFETDDCIGVAPLCSLAKLTEAFATKTCVGECVFAECGYAFGLCTPDALPPNCSVGYGPSEGSCLQCEAGFLHFFGYCLNQCPHGYRPHPLYPTTCFEQLDYSTNTQPASLFVLKSPTAENHYADLMDAFAAAWQNYTVINLIGEEYEFNPRSVLSKRNIDYFAHAPFPDLLSGGRWSSLTLRSQLCTEAPVPGCSQLPTTLNFRTLLAYSLASKTLIFDNVRITTRAAFSLNSPLYCPILTQTGTGFTTDQGTRMDDVNWSTLQCRLYSDLVLFTVGAEAALSLIVREF